MTPFSIDERLQKDSQPVISLELCDVRLMNDSRWPWLVLVPRIPAASEIHDLVEKDQLRLAKECAAIAACLKQVTGCAKINTAAIGNIVSQLHIHVIARTQGDPNWPGTVWGYRQSVPYEEPEAAQLVAAIKHQFAPPSKPR